MTNDPRDGIEQERDELRAQVADLTAALDKATAFTQQSVLRELTKHGLVMGDKHDATIARAEKAEAQRDRLATDALAHLAGAGIATPVEGYVKAPHCLSDNIDRLARERDEARAAVQSACDVAVTAAVEAIERERDEAWRERDAALDAEGTRANERDRMEADRDAARAEAEQLRGVVAMLRNRYDDAMGYLSSFCNGGRPIEGALRFIESEPPLATSDATEWLRERDAKVRAAALEEAAKAVEGASFDYPRQPDYPCERVRALATTPPPEVKP